MDPKAQSSPPNIADVKAAFHKPSNDASNRNYRRHSPASNSSSSDGSPEHVRAYSPKYGRDDASRPPEYRERKKADEKDLYKDSGRSHYIRGGDSYTYSDRHASRGSRGFSRIGEQTRHRMDEEERDHHKSTHGVRESKRGSYSDRTRRDSDYSRSKDFTQDGDRYSRDKYDDLGHRSKDREKESGRRNDNFEESERDRRKRDVDDRSERKDYHRSSGDRRIDRTLSREESKGYHSSCTARRDTDGHQSKEGNRNDVRDRDSQKLAKEKKSSDDCSLMKKDKDQQKRGADKHLDNSTVFKSDKSSPTKRPRLFSSERDPIFNKDDNAKHSLGLKESQETSVKAIESQPHACGTEAANDLSAAKSAAMRAAEMVNKNLAGGFGPTGYLSTEQKKKLLWGNKKNTVTEEPAHHWDVSLIADRERQEKFSKLMSLRLPWYLWPIVGCEGRAQGGAASKQRKWEQPSASRKAEGAAIGFRETIHRWTSKEGWPNGWSGTLSTLRFAMYDFLLRYFVKVILLVPLACGVTKKDADLHPGISDFCWEDFKCSFAAIAWYALHTFLAL
ncbi:arginine/serine-rich coiled-coil protein 2 isoform X2 [Rhodamnia argentea]|uniref:Arginine/serine-rich coiled-coil protein 2 isoform X2 n=1 Tax=Rhodamnia argentea TaxID=178133 RepID=A0A8B8QYV6_9MYRT|nr:arginine/serine-rich coiled-coil protein 2 isoform X2 [Rhodamnia argentea]